jgi:hypothetical protein
MSASADETLDIRLADGTVYPFIGFLIQPNPVPYTGPPRAEGRMLVHLCPGCYALTAFPSGHHHAAHGVNQADSREARRGIQIGDNNTQTNTF